MFYIYLASSQVLRDLFLGKLGCTEDPYGRRGTYLTGCPPGLTPSHDIEYDGIWETNATTRDELFDCEDEVHNHFLKYRMMRTIPGDTEWFNFQGKNPYDEVKRFMDSRPWVKRQVSLYEISPRKRPSRYLRKQYHKNLKYIKKRILRNEVLSREQLPVIDNIIMFMKDLENRAGYVIGPCGSGKTVMASKGIRGVKKCVICCPSRKIQNQWFDTLIDEGVFTESQIYIVGSAGTTDPSTIRKHFDEDEFCIISTYMSSHLLVDIINAELELLVLDEAHHMAGVVSGNETGEGRTRRLGEGRTRLLMMRASTLGVKRLSLTYTPRFISDNGDTGTEYLSMDDVSIFGKNIGELKIRNLINKGVLPDYRLWTLRDKSKKGTGIIGKAECILEAWGATEIIRGEEKHILHHLIVFAATIQDAKDLESFFKEKATDTLVIRVEGGDNLEEPIARYSEAPRAILVNCFVLDEGVDIPITNAVAITYPKQSRGQITQMVLRAGRWYEDKSVFHVLIPTLGDEDLSGFEEVLYALASCDEKIRDEIVLRAKQDVKPSDPLPPSPETGDTLPECIMIEEFEADQEEIKRCFKNIRKNLFPARESRRIQELCIEKDVDTSLEYSKLRSDIPELPENPLPRGVLWYNYLHPKQHDRISCEDFVRDILNKNNIRVGHTYDAWRDAQPEDIKSRLPSVQHITDGFFGEKYSNFNTLLEEKGQNRVRRRR